MQLLFNKIKTPKASYKFILMMSGLEVKISHNDNSNHIPAVRLPLNISQQELNNPQLIQIAQSLFEKNGVLQIDSLFPKTLVANLAEAFDKTYRAYFDREDYADSLKVGDKRKIINVEVESVFNNPQLYANPLLLNLMQKLLGQDYILGSFGAVIALPGAKQQHIHRDYPPLFDNEFIDARLPSFAITAVIPLVDLTEATGSTIVWKKSHRMARSQELKMADCLHTFDAHGFLLFNGRSATTWRFC